MVSISNLDTFEDAENWSEMMTVLTGFFTLMEKDLPDPAYLYGWDIAPKMWSTNIWMN